MKRIKINKNYFNTGLSSYKKNTPQLSAIKKSNRSQSVLTKKKKYYNSTPKRRDSKNIRLEPITN